MSPLNSDDAEGVASGGAGRPLTRKEIRARESLLATQGHDVVPPHASGTGGHAPAPTAAQPPAGAPELPAAAPTVHHGGAPEVPGQEVDSYHRAGDDDPVPAHEAPGYDVDAHMAPGYYAPDHAAPSYDADAHAAPGYDADAHEVPGYDADAHGADAYQDSRDAGYGDGFPDRGGVTAGGAARPEDESGHELLTGATNIPAAKGLSKKVRRRRRLLALMLTLTLFVVAAVMGAQFLKPLLGGNAVQDYPGPGTGQVMITVPEGAGPKSVATELRNKNVIADAGTFLKAFLDAGGALSPGEFIMRQEMKNSDAVAVLLNKDKGKVMYLALNAGLRINESLQAVSDGTGVPLAELSALSNAPAQFGVPARAKNLEGFLAPGEYRFPLGTSAKDILQTLVSTTLNELKAQGVTDPSKQYDVVTVASIVQAEGGQAEYGDVAGAIYNRLKPGNTETNGLIQSDATVTYGLGIKSFHIDEAQKADKSNPYNTYANPGLPAGPIGSPGKTAIDAAANPKSNEFLYWVTINLDSKETKFSKTLAEHNRYVGLYNAWCNANPGRCV